MILNTAGPPPDRGAGALPLPDLFFSRGRVYAGRLMNRSLYRYYYYYGPLFTGRSGRAMGCRSTLKN